MSSISASDRARQTDEARQAREDYQAAEAESAKKKRAEKKKMQESHQEEVNRLKTQFNDQIDVLKKKQREQLTTRDQQNQEQIDRVKNLYLEQIRRKTQDHETARREAERSYEAEVTSLKNIQSGQKEAQSRGYVESLREKEMAFADFHDRARETMQKTIQDKTQKLNEKHTSDIEVLIEDRNKQVTDLSQDKAKAKMYYEGELRDAKRSRQREYDKINDHWMRIHNQNEKNNDKLLTNRNEVLQAEKESLRNEYASKIDEKMEQLEGAHENLKEQVDSRINSQVRSLAHELHQSKNDRVVDMITNRRLRDLDRKHLEEQQYARLQNLDKERNEMRDTINEQAQKKMQDVSYRADRIVQDTNRNNKMKQNVQDLQSREGRQQLEFEMRTRLDQTKDQADKRVRRVMNIASETGKNQVKFHEQNIDQLKENYADNLSSQREAQMEQIKNIQLRAEERLHQMDLKSTKKMEDTVANYEAKIEKMREDSRLEKQRMVDMYEQRMAQREKQLRSEQESTSMKYEARVAQADEMRRKEIERLERKHEEQLTNLASRMRYLNKKA